MRNYALIAFGLNTALMISDILALTCGDVYDFEEKPFKIHVNTSDYVFVSRNVENKPITRYMAIKIIKTSCAAVGIKENVDCHSLRKTFGYHSWKK